MVRNVVEDGLEYPLVLKSSELTYLPYEPRSFAYCSDTAPFKRLYGWIKGVDLLYHEATYDTSLADMAKSTLHSTTADAANCAVEVGADKLIISHFSSRYKSLDPLLKQAQEIFPNTVLAKEGIKFEIPLKK